MSKVYVSCYRFLARDNNNMILMAPMAPSLLEDSVEITHDSLQSKVFPKYTSFIMIKADAPCSITVGKDPYADPRYHFLEGGEVRYYGVEPGFQIAVINSEGIL